MKKSKTNKVAPPKKFITPIEADQQFINTVRDSRPDDGGNLGTRIHNFVTVMRHLEVNKSFTIDDVLTATKAFDIEYQEATKLFNKWLAVMIQTGRISSVDGVYNSETYFFNY